MTYDEMEQYAYREGIDIDYVDFNSQRIKGLYCDGSIAINQNIETTT